MLFGGCNLFRDAFDTQPETADEHIIEAQLFLQKSEYGKALLHFEKAIKMDSSKSEAYYGAAKAVLLQERINMFELLLSFDGDGSGSLPFIGEPDSVRSKIYVANRGINKYLKILVAREKLGKTDQRIGMASISADYALASALEAVLSLADVNGDGIIDARDNILDGIIDFKNLTKVNPDSLMANIKEVQNDTVKIKALNDMLTKSNELLTQSDAAIDLFLNQALGSKGGGDSLGLSGCPAGQSSCPQGEKSKAASDSTIQQIKSFIGGAGASIVIYKIADGVDNDGDGCVDEEYLDGVDNDGDGFVDEDSRGVPDKEGNPRYFAVSDKADNNGNGQIDEQQEALFNTRFDASFEMLRLAAFPGGAGQIFWEDSIGAMGNTFLKDRRDTVYIVDNAVKPVFRDTVVTFDLCKGPVKGYKRRTQ